MIVMKFGGTSLGSADRIKNACNIVKSRSKEKPVVVVSAVSGITNMLIELANENNLEKRKEILSRIKDKHLDILKNLNIESSLLKKNLNELEDIVKKINDIDTKTFDLIQSFGERMSSKIVAEQLNQIGIKSQAFNSYDLGFLTDANFGSAEPLDVTYSNLKNKIDGIDAVPVITGFLGKTEDGQITTIGRGGSDFTASIVGAAISADEIQIWTDVDGMMSTDPKLVENAKTIDKVSFAEASELAYFGARVLHPKSILPAMRKNIPVRILNSLNPDHNGTAIQNKVEQNHSIVKAIAYKNNITLINIQSTRMLGAHGFLARLFGIFEKYNKSVDVISTSEVSVSMTIDNDDDLPKLVSDLEKISKVKVFDKKSIICVVGEGMRHAPGIPGRTFSVMGREKINIDMISQGASEINVTFVVDGHDSEKAVIALHEEHFGDQE
tara:strand:+ start:445 stop:1764 length:1320 start_codon:yes stop_codon:yes gene_type:complete